MSQIRAYNPIKISQMSHALVQNFQINNQNTSTISKAQNLIN